MNTVKLPGGVATTFGIPHAGFESQRVALESDSLLLTTTAVTIIVIVIVSRHSSTTPKPVLVIIVTPDELNGQLEWCVDWFPNPSRTALIAYGKCITETPQGCSLQIDVKSMNEVNGSLVRLSEQPTQAVARLVPSPHPSVPHCRQQQRCPHQPTNTTLYPYETLFALARPSLPAGLLFYKAQRQSLQVCGLHLENPCFLHEQLYVTCSRIGKPSDLFVYAPEGKTKNITYPKAFQ
ncbi:hypothetical protein ANTPLA_LOCUS10073 [Anthophora plagiata]